MQTIKKQLLAVAIATVFSQPLLAAECSSDPKLTGWGPWCIAAPLEATAAGGTTVASVSSSISSPDIGDVDIFGGDPEEPTPESTPEPTPTVTSHFYRAGVDYDRVDSSKEGDSYEREEDTGIGLTEFTFSEGEGDADSSVQVSHFDMDGNPLPESGVEIISGNSEPADPPADPGENINIYVKIEESNNTIKVSAQDGILKRAYVQASTQDTDSGADVRANELSYYDNDQEAIIVLKNYWRGYSEYYEQTNITAIGAYHSDGRNGQKQYFVGGDLTPLSVVEQNQSIEADYSGRSSIHNQSINITVDFSAGEFDGTWAGGDAASVNFYAKGVILGQHISANTITDIGGGNDYVRNVDRDSSLQGSFFGANAQGLAGNYEIFKTEQGGSGSFNDVFSTAVGGIDGDTPN